MSISSENERGSGLNLESEACMSSPSENERGSVLKRKSEACLVTSEEDGGRVEAGASGIRSVKRREVEVSDKGNSMNVFVDLVCGKIVEINLSREETVSSLRERIAKATGINVSVGEQRLIHRGTELDEWKSIEESGVERDSTLYLVGRLCSYEDAMVWRNLNGMLSAAIMLCDGESYGVGLAEQVVFGMDLFLHKVKVVLEKFKTDDRCIKQDLIKDLKRHFHVFNSLTPVSTLSMLYLSPVEDNKEVGRVVIQRFLTAVLEFPEELNAYALPLVYQFCMNFRATVPRPLFYHNCMSTLFSLMKTALVSGSTKDVHSSVSLKDIVPFFIEVGSKLLDDLTKSLALPSIVTPSIKDVQDFSSLFSVVLGKILKTVKLEDPSIIFDGALELPFFEQQKSLYGFFNELLMKMDVCLRSDDGSSITECGVCIYKSVGLQYLLILRALNSMSVIYQGATKVVRAMLKTRKIGFRFLVMRFANKIGDKNWLLEHKDILGFRCRKHLAMTMFPEHYEDHIADYVMLIDRSKLRDHSVEYIMQAEPKNLQAGVSIHFKNEDAEGVGLSREWFIMIFKELFSTQSALFIANPNDRRRFSINSMSEVDHQHLKYFRACGRFIALALMSRVLVGIALDRVLFLQLAGHDVKLEDIKDTDPTLYRSCRQILCMDASFVDSDALGLTFVAEYEVSGSRKVVELCPDGAQIKVNSSNRAVYVDSLIHSRFVESISIQLAELAKGFEDVVLNSERRLFFFRSLKLEDLDHMLRGSESDICVEDWKAHTNYNGYKDTDSQIIWFWEIVAKLSSEERRQLLFFWTAIKYLPFYGFARLSPRLKILKERGTAYHLPSSHTCFNMMSLPEYPTYQMMKQKIAVIIQEHIAASFGFA